MKNVHLSSLILILFGAALTCFLWLPLLPVVIPLVTLTIGAKWIETILFSDSTRKSRASRESISKFNFGLLHYSTVHSLKTGTLLDPHEEFSTAFDQSKDQQKVLPAVSRRLEPDKINKNSISKKTLREYRKFTRVMNGLAARRSFVHGSIDI